jgi:hypothetical protein
LRLLGWELILGEELENEVEVRLGLLGRR